MTIHEWLPYAVAGASVLGLLRVLWSTNGRQLAKYRKVVAEGVRTITDRNDEIARLREAELLLREANRKLREALKSKENEVETHKGEILQLKQALERQRTANDKLNEMLGMQEQHINGLRRDVTMLQDQVGKLRAQLGLEL